MTSTSDEVGHTATPWYEAWSKIETLALIRDGVRRGKIKDQTILGPNGQMAALSEILSFHTKLETPAVNSHDSLVKALEEQKRRNLHLRSELIGRIAGDGAKKFFAVMEGNIGLIDAALSQAKGGK